MPDFDNELPLIMHFVTAFVVDKADEGVTRPPILQYRYTSLLCGAQVCSLTSM